jgi:hypothetical protein
VRHRWNGHKWYCSGCTESEVSDDRQRDMRAVRQPDVSAPGEQCLTCFYALGRPMVCLRGPLTGHENIPDLTPPVHLGGGRYIEVIWRTTADSDGL